MEKPKIAFDVNFFIFRRRCRHQKGRKEPVCRWVDGWEELIKRGDAEVVMPSGIVEVLADQNLKRGMDPNAGLEGFDGEEKYLGPVIRWMREFSSPEFEACLQRLREYGADKDLIEECSRMVDREDLAIYAQASVAGADYVVTGDRAWQKCEDYFKLACVCASSVGDEFVRCGTKLPKVAPLSKPPKT